LGIKHKIILELKKITEIKKKNTLGLLPNALKISTDDGKAYKFSSFSNRNGAYKAFISLWKNVSAYAKSIDEDEEEVPDQEESETEELEVREENKASISANSSQVGKVNASDSTSVEPKYVPSNLANIKGKFNTELPQVQKPRHNTEISTKKNTSKIVRDHSVGFNDDKSM